MDESGFHPTQEKLKAIQEASEPKNLQEMQFFLEMINYYSHFLPNLSQLAPLSCWYWKSQQTEAFQSAKKAL